MLDLKNKISLLINLPKIIFINFRTLPFVKAYKLPILINGKTKFRGFNKRTIEIQGDIYFGMIRIGLPCSEMIGLNANRVTTIIVKEDAKLIFKGEANIGKGSAFWIGGELVLGKNFNCNINCFISCYKCIYFGNNNLLGWDVNIRDNDGHDIYDFEGNIINEAKNIVFGDDVWISANVSVLKNVRLMNDTVIGCDSLLTKQYSESNVVIVGNNGKIVKRNIKWRQ